ncbi:MAG: sigma-70 family RNA polymerase sigma factor [Lachnospiraceae bacterium]|nr:sigma-70 family RNA polymerase sigma factor [Lachnospiraceae bacterium]
MRREAERINREEQLSALIDSYQHLVFSICYKMTSDYFASEDLTQETFLSAYNHLKDFDGKYEKAWLCRIATNKCIDYLQSAGRRAVPTEDVMLNETCTYEGVPESVCLEEEVRQTLLARCMSLKPPYDEIAKAYYYDEMDVSEISVQRGMKLKTVQTQVYRARAMLRKLYGKEKGA